MGMQWLVCICNTPPGTLLLQISFESPLQQQPHHRKARCTEHPWSKRLHGFMLEASKSIWFWSWYADRWHEDAPSPHLYLVSGQTSAPRSRLHAPWWHGMQKVSGLLDWCSIEVRYWGYSATSQNRGNMQQIEQSRSDSRQLQGQRALLAPVHAALDLC